MAYGYQSFRSHLRHTLAYSNVWFISATMINAADEDSFYGLW
jgi:hypothetical protein